MWMFVSYSSLDVYMCFHSHTDISSGPRSSRNFTRTILKNIYQSIEKEDVYCAQSETRSYNIVISSRVYYDYCKSYSFTCYYINKLLFFCYSEFAIYNIKISERDKNLKKRFKNIIFVKIKRRSLLSLYG